MADKDIEVEIKVPLEKEAFFNLKVKLREICKFEKASQQSDAYFSPAHRDFVEPEFPFEWLSIRKRAGKTILNYKHFHPENVEVTTHCDEFEAVIENPEQLEKIFSSLNFKKLVTVEKERETYLFNDEFEVALDEVNDLGYFIEVEALKDFGGVEETRRRLLEFAGKLGIDASKIDKRGYPYLLMEKKGLLK